MRNDSADPGALLFRRTLLAAGLICCQFWAQCPPAPTWLQASAIPGVAFQNSSSAYPSSAGQIYSATVWDPDGAGPASPLLVVGGLLTHAGEVLANHVATWDGAAWRSLGSGLDGDVQALAVYNGDLIAGGSFTSAGGTPVSHVARWDGISWQPLGAGLDNDAQVLIVHNGELIVGGKFSSAGASAASRVARWNGSSWAALGSGVSDPGSSYSHVNVLTEYNGDLIVGGYFTTAGGISANNIARWDGASWQSLGGGLSSLGPVIVFNGDLLAEGGPGICRWTGSIWQLVAPGAMQCLSVYNGDLVGGAGSGGFGGGQSVSRWNGSSWVSLSAGSPLQGSFYQTIGVSCLIVYQGELIACGLFSLGSMASVARWNGTSWSSLGTGTSQAVHAFATHNGDLYAGCERGYVARWDGSSSWQPVGLGMAGTANAISALTDYGGNLVAAGNLYAPACLASWDGATWQAVAPVCVSPINTLATYNGDLYVGGSFTAHSPIPANFIDRWNGSQWSALGTGLDYYVYALTIYNGRLIVGGAFATAGGAPASSIASWDGSSWHTLGTGISGGAVRALTVFNGDLIAGGTFAGAGGVQATCIARWDGAAWHALGNVGTTGVYSLGVLNGTLFAGAATWALPSGVTHGIAYFDGTTWQPLGSGLSGSAPAAAIAGYGGELFVGGDFFSAGGVNSPFVARWSVPNPMVSVSQPGSTGSGLVVTNTGLLAGVNYFNVFSLDLCAAGPGTGPWGGLCANDPGFLVQQVTLPLGYAPFNYIAAAGNASFGPYPLPVGFAFEALIVDSVDVNAGTIGCISPVIRYAVY